MAKRKPQRSQSRKQEENIFSGTEKLANTAIKAYKVGGMSLVLVIVGLIGFLFTFIFKSTLDIMNYILAVIICVLLFGTGVYIYLKEQKII